MAMQEDYVVYRGFFPCFCYFNDFNFRFIMALATAPSKEFFLKVEPVHTELD